MKNRKLRFSVWAVSCAAFGMSCGSREVAAPPASVAAVDVGDSSTVDPNEFFNAVKATLDALYGTPAQRAAADQARFDAEQDAYAACMSAARQTYLRPTTQVTEQVESYVPKMWLPADEKFAAVDGFGGFTHFAGPISVQADSYNSLSVDERAAYDTALTTCTNEVQNNSQAGASLNPEATRLAATLEGQLRVATMKQHGGAIATYASCMSNSGYPRITNPANAQDGAQELIAEAGLNNTDDPAILAKAIDFDRGVAVADARCRLPLAAEVAGVLQPIYDQWITENRAAVDTAVQGWGS